MFLFVDKIDGGYSGGGVVGVDLLPAVAKENGLYNFWMFYVIIRVDFMGSIRRVL